MDSASDITQRMGADATATSGSRAGEAALPAVALQKYNFKI